MKKSFIIGRWLLAAGFLYLAWRLCMGGDGRAMILAVLILMTGAILMVPEVVRMIGGWFGERLVRVIFPDDRGGKPPLSYTLARHYRRQHRTEEAIAEYRKIIRDYPKEKDAYVELLTLAMHEGEDKIYQKYARMARRRLRCDIEIVQPPPIYPPPENTPS